MVSFVDVHLAYDCSTSWPPSLKKNYDECVLIKWKQFCHFHFCITMLLGSTRKGKNLFFKVQEQSLSFKSIFLFKEWRSPWKITGNHENEQSFSINYEINMEVFWCSDTHLNNFILDLI